MKKIKNFIINKKEKTSKALKLINKNRTKICFVVDENNKLIGSVTDGDIRRQLLNNSSINDNVYKYDHNIKKVTTNDIFKKYLFFKTKSKLMRILSKKIIYIFRKIDFIIN